MVVSVMKCPRDFISFPLRMDIIAARLPWILSYMQNGGRGWFVDVSAGLSHPRHVRHIPIFIGSRVIKEGT